MLELERRVLAIQRRGFYPEDHPEVLETLESIAGAHYMMTSYAEAEAGYRRVLDAKQVVSDRNPSVAKTLGNLSKVHLWQGRSGEAVGLAKRAVAISEKVLGPEHADSLEHLDDLAVALQTDDGRLGSAPDPGEDAPAPETEASGRAFGHRGDTDDDVAGLPGGRPRRRSPGCCSREPRDQAAHHGPGLQRLGRTALKESVGLISECGTRRRRSTRW